MVFVPSQASFPIVPIRVPFEEGGQRKECFLCYNPFASIFGSPREKADQSYFGGEYRLVKRYPNKSPSSIERFVVWDHELQYVCKACLRWIPFNYSAFQKPFGYDLLSKTKKEWWAIKDKIFADFPEPACAHLYKFLRKARNDQMIEYDWRSRFSKKEVEWLEAEFYAMRQDYDHCDNFRVADASKDRQVKRYWKEAKMGCCGRVDIKRSRWFGLGKTYLMGFNYGH